MAGFRCHASFTDSGGILHGVAVHGVAVDAESLYEAVAFESVEIIVQHGGNREGD